MSVYEKNKIDVKKDGRILIYKRPNSGVYQMRLRVSNSTGYKILSTKTNDIDEAKRIAVNTYEEIYMRVQSGGSLASKTFSDLYKSWVKDLPTLSQGKHELYEEQNKKLAGNYPLTFFGDYKIDQLNNSDFQEYFMWRRKNSYSKTPQGKKKKFTPTNNTILHECNVINLMLKYAVGKKWLVKIPDYDRPQSEKDNRRPTFTLSEWRLLTRQLKSWSNEKQLVGNAKRQRFYLYNYILILANTGLRIGEMRKVSWNNLRLVDATGDITLGEVENNTGKRMVANVSGKTGEREVVFNKGTEDYFARIFDYRSNELNQPPERDEIVICHPNGSEVQSMSKSFDRLLQKYELTYHKKNNKKRTLYSLRHFYATQRLEQDVNPFLLAKNMGTSVEMLHKFYGQIVSSLIAGKIAKSQFTSKEKSSDTAYPWQK
tara:strand:+ start:5823 stop:7109 length:1287 start_codon:yes stop_codon:yes gene_type:complete